MTDNIGQKTFTASVFTIAGTWVKRLLGIISIIIIARILSPDDYGVVAIAQLSFVFFQILLSDGSRVYLIRKQDVNNEDYNTAWTIRLIIVILIALIVFLGKEVISEFFNEPRLVNILQYLPIGFFISGFQNIGYIIYERKLEYKIIFWYDFSVKLAGFIVSVSLAFYIKNYWALIFGLISMQVTSTIMSYILFEYRPSFTLCQIKTQWDFTKWIFLSNFTSFIRNKLDQVLISKYLGVKDLGFFNMTYQLSNIPYSEIIEPISRVVYSSYSRVLNDKKKLAEMYVQVLGVLSIISFPMYFGLIVLSKDVVFLLLGDKWNYVNTLFPIIVLLLLSQSLSLIASNLLTVLGRVKLLAFLNWLMVLVMIPIMLYVMAYKDLYLFVWARALIALIFFIVFYYALIKLIRVKKMLLIMAIVRPLFASIVMALIIHFVTFFDSWPIILSLSIEIIMGTILYSVLLVFLWMASGKALGGEKYILDKIYFLGNKNKIFRKYFINYVRKFINN